MMRRAFTVATPALLAIGLLLAACASGGGASGSSSATPTPTPKQTASPTPPTPTESPLDVIDFDVNGTIGGHAVQGKLAQASFTVPCATTGSDQIITVHWIGEAPVNTALQGEIDFKPGTWTLGSMTAQGTTTVGLQGGKANDALVATAGTVTTATTGGTINGTFTGGADSLKISGSWTCPPPS
jgi:hypothetical protein